MGTATAHSCPLCAASCISDIFYSDRLREYYRCPKCFLIFVPPQFFLSPEEEKNEYDLHQNSSADSGYRQFLSNLFTPMQKRIQPGSKGLDFGSGPGPTLSVMFEEKGYDVALYDPIYAPDRSVLNCRYDFICASEVLEHFREPAADLSLLWSLLKTGGWLGIMTGMARDRDAFAGWRYKDDRSHIVFFSENTMAWIAEKWRAKLMVSGRNVTLFQKR